MTDPESTDNNSIHVSMELSGPYQDVIEKLGPKTDRNDSIYPLLRDAEEVLETVERLQAGTRSTIAAELPAEMTVDYDAESLVDLLQVLKRYGLLELDGNTWKIPDETET
ncbi:hypothetical protein [Halobellus inordinatus]|uniref:hypothetical protein n=1 Tax=Halobellus inordinatus TaxID=1126236 RepID=UPI00210A51F7|nr:hypothetical protein [Halobellus inordinatus]